MERGIGYLTESWWTSARVDGPADAQCSLDAWCADVADQRPRPDGQTVGSIATSEPLRQPPAHAYPAEIRVERQASRSALVAYDGNRYSIPPAHADRTVLVYGRVGDPMLRIASRPGEVIAQHRQATPGAGQTIRTPEHARLLEQAVLAAFTTEKNVPAQAQPAAVGHRAGRAREGPRPRRDHAGARHAGPLRSLRAGVLMQALHRFEAHATIKPGEDELNLAGQRVQLVRIELTDEGPVIADGGDGPEHRRPDVVCPLRPADARALALRLLELADHATAIQEPRP